MSPVVIYRLGSLGDTVVSLPCFHKIAEIFPDRERIVLTNVPVSSKAAPVEAILGGSGLIQGTLSYPAGTRSPAELWRLRRQLQGLGADTLIFLSEPRGLRAVWRDAAFFRLSGIRHILGAPLTPDLQTYRKGPDGLEEQECRRLARCLAPLGPIALDDPEAWDLRLAASEREAGRTATAPFGGAPFLAIHMGGKVAINDWGAANWIGLIDALGARLGGGGLLVLGAAEEAPRAAEVAKRWPGKTVNACGLLSPRHSAAALAEARLFIGHDSGPLHLASASLCPWIGIFGENNPPRRWHPVIGPGEALHDMRGVRAITVAQILNSAARLIGDQ